MIFPQLISDRKNRTPVLDSVIYEVKDESHRAREERKISRAKQRDNERERERDEESREQQKETANGNNICTDQKTRNSRNKDVRRGPNSVVGQLVEHQYPHPHTSI